jgi:hypothetical protein
MKQATISLDARANYGYDTLLMRGEIPTLAKNIANRIADSNEVTAVDIVGAMNTLLEYTKFDSNLSPSESPRNHELHKSTGDYSGLAQVLERDELVISAGRTPHRVIIVNSEQRLAEVRKILVRMNYSVE